MKKFVYLALLLCGLGLVFGLEALADYAKVGAKAAGFSLPTVIGGEISLQEYNSNRVVILFGCELMCILSSRRPAYRSITPGV